MAECADKNLIDKDEYPQSAELERRCVNILAGLWNAAPAPPTAVAAGCSTIGSSEACMLAGLALHRTLAGSAGGTRSAGSTRATQSRHGHQRAGLLGEVLPLLGHRGAAGPRRPRRHPPHRPKAPSAACDDNTIGVVAVLGSTYDGAYEPVAEIAAALDAAGEGRWPGRADARRRRIRWLHRAVPRSRPRTGTSAFPRVQSINASGHKYGLVYPGVGWVVWRDAEALPEELVFQRRLPGRQHADVHPQLLPARRPRSRRSTTTSCGSASRATGRSSRRSRDTAMWLAGRSRRSVRSSSCRRGDGIPAFAFRLRPQTAGTACMTCPRRSGARGWIVPAYQMPPASTTWRCCGSSCATASAATSPRCSSGDLRSGRRAAPPAGRAARRGSAVPGSTTDL